MQDKGLRAGQLRVNTLRHGDVFHITRQYEGSANPCVWSRSGAFHGPLAVWTNLVSASILASSFTHRDRAPLARRDSVLARPSY